MCKTIISFDVGVKNLSYCIFSIDESNKLTVQKWDSVSIVDSSCIVNKLGIHELSNAMLDFLFKTFFCEKNDLVFTKVIIENQPSMMNGLMKSLSMVIYTFFKMHQDVNAVSFINSCNKLKCNKSKALAKASKTYNQRKKLAIDTCRLYLEEIAPDLLPWFNQHKKADDLADSFLYNIYTIENSKI